MADSSYTIRDTATQTDKTIRLIDNGGGTYSISASGGGLSAELVKYNATPPTLTDGQTVEVQSDTNGNTKVILATIIAGEDITNDVIQVENHFFLLHAARRS